METKKNLLDNLKKVCLCRSIKAGTVMAAIRDGALTFEALRRKIGVGTGNCKAKRCRTKIEDRIKDYKAGQRPVEVEQEPAKPPTPVGGN